MGRIMKQEVSVKAELGQDCLSSPKRAHTVKSPSSPTLDIVKTKQDITFTTLRLSR